MCQSVNVSGKMAVQNAGYVFGNFCADTKIFFGYNFVTPLITKTWLTFEEIFT